MYLNYKKADNINSNNYTKMWITISCSQWTNIWSRHSAVIDCRKMWSIVELIDALSAALILNYPASVNK